ncbi:MAG: ion channel [Clostridia bacterium]
MLITIPLTLLLVATCVFLHYETLQASNAWLPRLSFVRPRARVLVAFVAAMASHLAHVLLFAAALYFLQGAAGVGRLSGKIENVFPTFLYFSLETYTSLGFGDVYPLGAIRLIAGVETLMGLLLISWTASFTYLEMARYWSAPPPQR